MKLGKFNFGGLFGGLVCGAAAFAIIYLLADRFPRGGYKAVALAAFGGAALGNWIWGFTTPAISDQFDWNNHLNGDQNRASS